MHSLGLKTCGDLQKRTVAELVPYFGSWAQRLSELAIGVDNRPVQSSSARKSLTVEETFGENLPSLEACRARLPELYADWEGRMHRQKSDLTIRSYVVKVKFHDFKSTTHETSSRRWPELKDFEKLLEHAWERRAEPVRLLGLGVRLVAPDERSEERGQLAFNL